MARILVDASAAGVGGLGTYVRHLMPAWANAFPEDELLVFVSPDNVWALPGCRVMHLQRHGPAAFRPVAQVVATRSAMKQFRPNALLATMPSVALGTERLTTVVVLHDFRHELLPEQFNRSTRAARRVSYAAAYRRADSFICISERTRTDFQALHPKLADSVPTTVVHHGADHVASWHLPPRHPERNHGHALAFAQHNNKNPELAIAAWNLARSRGLALPRLMILGADEPLRGRLKSHVLNRGLGDRVEVSSYLSDAEFRQVFGGSVVTLFPSAFEGFGLPALEAMNAGVPVVISNDAALREVTRGHAVVMTEMSPSALLDATMEALGRTPQALQAAAEHAERFTWARSANETRCTVLEAIARRTAKGLQ